MSPRTGLPTLRFIAVQMCRLILKFTPVIERLYADVPALLAALAAASAACEVLRQQIDLNTEIGV